MSFGIVIRTVVYICAILGLVNYFFYFKYGHTIFDADTASRSGISFDWFDFRTPEQKNIEPFKAGADNLEGGETVIKWQDKDGVWHYADAESSE